MNARTALRRVLPLALMLILPGCGLRPVPSNALTPVTVQLSFSHQAEFAGFYAADQQGYYAAQGLKVSFVPGGPEADFIAPVAGGQAQFGVALPSDVILARAAGKPVRAIAAIYRRSPIAFFTLANSGITRPQDFAGKKIRSTTSVDQTLRAMMSRVGIPADQYESVHLPSEVNRFASGEVPIWGGYTNVFVLEVQRAGYALNIIYPDDYGIHFYGDVLITTDDLIAGEPGLVERFLRASLQGWTYAVENPEAAGALVQKYNPQADIDLESARVTASIPLVNTGEDFVGWMKLEVWQTMEQTLLEQGLLASPVDVGQVYTGQFLEEIYSR